MVNYNLLEDYEKDMLSYQEFNNRILDNSIVLLKGKNYPVFVGRGLGLKINTSIGINHNERYKDEVEKIHTIAKHSFKPDIMMDLSTTKISTPLYLNIIEKIGCPVGTIPHYLCFNSKKGIDKYELLETIEQQAQNGVSFMTLHVTADLRMAEKTYSRVIPVISRGGSLLLRDMRINNRNENIILECLEEIIKILKKYSVVISLGTTFRPSTLSDAMDEVNLQEISEQHKIAKKLKSHGLRILMEGIGHIPIVKIPDYVSILRKEQYIPFMPLGPIVSDRTQGEDHITSAIGACQIALLNGADIINSVTREEHTGGIPNISSILEAIDVANTVVKIINDARFSKYFTKNSKEYFNCMGKSDSLGCERCGKECPFIWNKSLV